MKKLMVLGMASFLITSGYAVNYKCPNKQDLVRNGQWFCPAGWFCEPKTDNPPPLSTFDFNLVILNNRVNPTNGQCYYSRTRSTPVYIAIKYPGTKLAPVDTKYWRGDGNGWNCSGYSIEQCQFKTG